MVSRSQIDSARPEVVLTLIDSWRATAVELEESADEYVHAVEHPGGKPWTGLTAEAAVALANADRREIIRGADAITRMADRAFRGLTESVMPSLTNVRAMIDNAERQGFLVNNDLSVAWTRPAGISDATAEKFQEATLRFTRQIRDAAQEWWAAELQVSNQMNHDGYTLGSPSFDEGLRASKPRYRLIDRTWKQDPTPPPEPPISRQQAAAGLQDVDRRIWEHNHIEKPLIESLPANDPRRTDFHIDTELLNQEKRQYLDILPKQHPPTSVIGPGGVNLPGVPPGLISDTPAKSGQGWIYPIPPNQPGIDPRVVSIRVMESNAGYPNGYLNYLNAAGQEVDPFTGRTVPPSDPFAHIPI